jgi:hypothetical protein
VFIICYLTAFIWYFQEEESKELNSFLDKSDEDDEGQRDETRNTENGSKAAVDRGASLGVEKPGAKERTKGFLDIIKDSDLRFIMLSMVFIW